jgi:hypothetical protein
MPEHREFPGVEVVGPDRAWINKTPPAHGDTVHATVVLESLDMIGDCTDLKPEPVSDASQRDSGVGFDEGTHSTLRRCEILLFGKGLDAPRADEPEES